MSDDEVEVDTGGDITAAIAPAVATRAEASEGNEVTIQVGTSLELAERALIMATLRSLDGSKSKAAQVLGISLKTLYNRLHAYGGAARATLDALPDEASDVRLAA